MKGDKDTREVWALVKHLAPGSNRHGYSDYDYGHFEISFVENRDGVPYGLGGAHPLDDLLVTCQYNANEVRPYAFSVAYETRHVTLDCAKAMVKTLESIDRKYRKICEEWGYPQSFGQFALYVLKVLGVKGILVDKNPNRASFTDSEWLSYKVTDIEYLVNSGLDKVRESSGIKISA